MGTVAVDSVSDLLLLLLHANGRLRGRSRLAGVTRLQKLLFLLTETPEYQELVRAGLPRHIGPVLVGLARCEGGADRHVRPPNPPERGHLDLQRVTTR